jgi:hydrogenase nickel incorporation protein HypA/HybF
MPAGSFKTVMHELSLVAGLFETLVEQAREHKAREVTRVRLKVGRLSGVVPELLASAFDMYKKGTIAENASLEIDVVPLGVRCRACAAESRKEDFALTCPACGSAELEILQGTDIFLEKIELEIEEPAAGTTG